MLPKIDALPGAKRKATIRNGNGHVAAGQYCAHMGRHIVGALGAVHEFGIPILHHRRHKRFHVFHDIRIGVFAKYQAGAGVEAKNMRGTGFYAARFNDFDDVG